MTRPPDRRGWARSGAGQVVVGLACVAALLVGARASSEGPPAAVRTGAASGAAQEPLRIMPLGASSTVGTGSPATAGYRGPLQQLLAEDGIAVDLVGSQRDGPASVPDRDHEGRSGWTLARMTPAVAGWVRRARPDVVLLHAGTNDLLHGVSGATGAARLDALLDAVFSAAPAHVVVAGVWAPLSGRSRARAEFEAGARRVVAAHRARGHSVTYVDTSALLGRGELADGLHPNAAGYRRIAAMWEREILTRP